MIRRQLAGENKDSITAAEDLASSLDELGHLDDLTRLRDRALVSYRDALAIRQNLARDHPNNIWVRRGVAESWINVGMVTARFGRADEAREAFRSAAAILDRLVEDNPSSTFDRDLLFRSRRGLGEIEFAAERLDGAETEFQAALAALEPSSAESDQTINMQIDRVAVEVRLGEIDHRRRRFNLATERFGNAIVVGQKVLAKEPKHVMARVHLYEAHVRRALTTGCLRKYALAAADWEQAVDYGKGHADSAEIRLRGAMALACRGRLDEAERLVDQVAAEPDTNLGLYYNCACTYALILAVATDGSRQGASRALRPEALTIRAVAALRKHLSANASPDPDIIRALAADPDLEPLCRQPLYQTFFMDLAFPERPFFP
jgi:tetratricopeptide (TPR) repeat protein